MPPLRAGTASRPPGSLSAARDEREGVLYLAGTMVIVMRFLTLLLFTG